jgi:hypothetical protein
VVVARSSTLTRESEDHRDRVRRDSVAGASWRPVVAANAERWVAHSPAVVVGTGRGDPRRFPQVSVVVAGVPTTTGPSRCVASAGRSEPSSGRRRPVALQHQPMGLRLRCYCLRRRRGTVVVGGTMIGQQLRHFFAAAVEAPAMAWT